MVIVIEITDIKVFLQVKFNYKHSSLIHSFDPYSDFMR